MRTRLSHVVVGAIIAAAVVGLIRSPFVAVPPAAADSHDEPCGTCTVTPGNEGLHGRVEQQVNELNRYERNPEPCTWEDENGEEHQGEWAWVLVREVTDEPGEIWAAGLQYAHICVTPGGPGIPDGADGLGDMAPNVDRVSIFDAVTPENLARYAMEEFFLALPAPQPRFNPGAPNDVARPTMVNFDTWMWVEGIDSHLESEPISVPGITVQAFGDVSGVSWDMGDGNTVECTHLGQPYSEGATSDCIYPYQRSSAGEDGDMYHGSANIVWIGTYTVNDVLADAEFNIPRETPFALAVEEAQALNTDSDS